ncbi:MAG: anthranilate synthase component I family protein [Acidobacteriota bacterium]|nr:anthranilate synthase component I family protein [Acidobacteriota bacterium]
MTSIVPLAAPGLDLVLDSGVSGAALLEGWSDDGTWRILLPWPEKTRALPWDRACDWKSFLRETETSEQSTDAQKPECPFLGGWVGFISYEATACDEAAEPRTNHPPEPAAFFALHRAGVAIDPHGKAFLFAPERTEDHYLRALAASSTAGRRLPTADSPSPIDDSFAPHAYADAVERIRQAIRDGDVYQVNLTRSFTLQQACDPAELYRTLTAPHPPRSSAFIRGDGWTIASASPEVLLRFDRNTGVAESRPIKGTIRRGEDSVKALLASEKDASEHLMIVDVVRNDFGKIAPPGAVSVPAFRTVQSLEHVHHLESTVRAEGLENCTLGDVLAALSPAASITGAPKRAAVQMIRDVEPVARGVYCGSIGYIDFRGHAELSVAIRTAVATDSEVRYHAGGGIVWDSNAAAEDDETRAKSAAFLRFAGAER